MDTRPNYLDYAKAITIYLVILGHYVSFLELDFKCGPLWSVEHSITLFHMPLFFIASGILHKERPLKDQWLKTRDTLILPYICLNLICLLIGLLIFVDYEQENLIKYVLKQLLGIASGNDLLSIAFSGSLWFCYSLACIKLIMVATAVGEQKLKIKKQISRLSICVIGGV